MIRALQETSACFVASQVDHRELVVGLSAVCRRFAAEPVTRKQVISRLEAGEAGIDFRGARLFGSNFDGANLSELKSGADMRNQPMGSIKIVLTHASLKGAKLIGADLSRGDLSYAELREASAGR